MPEVSSRRVVVALAAAGLLLTSFVCIDAADARAHLVGDHESLAHPAAPAAPAGPTLGATDAHPECGDEAPSAAVCVAPVKLVPCLAAVALPPETLAPVFLVVAAPAGSPPAQSPGRLPLRI